MFQGLNLSETASMVLFQYHQASKSYKFDLFILKNSLEFFSEMNAVLCIKFKIILIAQETQSGPQNK